MLKLTLKTKDRFFGIIILLPALILILGLSLYPILQGFLLSFQKYNLLSLDEVKWIFLDNYKALFTDSTLWLSFKNTFIFTFSTLIGGFIIGISLALILNQKIFLQRFLRGVFLIPWLIAPVVTSLIFRYMFNTEVGIINYILKSLHIINNSLNWFGSGSIAMFTVIIITIWMQFPFHAVMYLATLQTIPDELNEAAIIDGCNVYQKFFHISLPFLKQTILLIFILVIIWNVNTFDIIFATTGGGPANETMVSGIYIYDIAFKSYDFGYASAVGTMWVIILIGMAYLFSKLMSRNRLEV